MKIFRCADKVQSSRLITRIYPSPSIKETKRETADRLSDDGPNISDFQDKPPSTLTSTSGNAVSRVALLFNTAALVTLIIVSLVWRRPASSKNGSGSALTRTRDVLMRWVWKPCLAVLGASLLATSLLTASSVTTPFPAPTATAISLLLGANGMLFALANWVPYALIAGEASAQARSRAFMKAEGDDIVDDEDNTPRLLAVHNVAITVPQIVASVASWLLMQGLALLGVEQNIVWIFVMCIPSALWAACL